MLNDQDGRNGGQLQFHGTGDGIVQTKRKMTRNQKRSAFPQSAQKAALPQNCLPTRAIVRPKISEVNTSSVTIK